MAPKEDYMKVRSLLDGRFGQKHKITLVCLIQVTNSPCIKAEGLIHLAAMILAYPEMN